jgi:hypothetical protein
MPSNRKLKSEEDATGTLLYYSHQLLTLPLPTLPSLNQCIQVQIQYTCLDQQQLKSPNPNRAYAAALVQYNTYHTVEQQPKTMLLEAVPATLVQLLEDQQFGYALVSTFTILNHFDTKYGVVTTQDLASNLDEMDKQ